MSGPSLPVPIPCRIDSGDFPVVTYEDVEAALPSFLQSDDPRAVRDALFGALQVILQTFQSRAGYAAALSDVLRSVDEPLQQIGREREIFTQPGDTNATLRARILTAPGVVTPQAILAAVGIILAPYTAILPRYSEASDRWYVRSAANAALTPRAYVYRTASIPTSPDYPDRGYPSEASVNGGFAIPQREPGAARVYSDGIGRYFHLRIPDLSALNSECASMFQGLAPSDGFYVSNGTSSANATFLRKNPATSTGVYAAIIGVVERIKGQSIRWTLLVDPNLVS